MAMIGKRLTKRRRELKLRTMSLPLSMMTKEVSPRVLLHRCSFAVIAVNRQFITSTVSHGTASVADPSAQSIPARHEVHNV